MEMNEGVKNLDIGDTPRQVQITNWALENWRPDEAQKNEDPKNLKSTQTSWDPSFRRLASFS